MTSFPGRFVRFYVSLTDIGNLASGFNPEEDPRGAIDTGKAVTNKWIWKIVIPVYEKYEYTTRVFPQKRNRDLLERAIFN